MLLWNTRKRWPLMPLAHYYVIGRHLHELKHRAEFLPIRKGIMDKFGASILLSFSGLFISYVTRNELGFVHVIPSGIAACSCWYRHTIATQHDPHELCLSSLSLYKKSTIVSCHRAELVSFWTWPKLLLRS